MNKVKTHGQVFTPPHIVREMLDLVGFVPEELAKIEQPYRILEPSFGDGAFLFEIVDRLIKVGELCELSEEELKSLIDESVCGVEIDADLYVETVSRLRKHTQKLTNIEPVFPRLVNMDALDYVGEGFDYVVGNPPYVRVHHLDADTREKLKKFRFSTGNSDLYVVFFEKFVELLKPEGEFVFIAPNSWLKNKSQESFRSFLLGEKLIQHIKDYGSEKVFKNASTYTAIVRLNRKSKSSYVYELGEDCRTIDYVGGSDVVPVGDSSGTLLGDVVDVKNGLQTSADKIFVKPVGEWVIEEELLVPAFKGGKLGDGVQRAILFPYHIVDGKVSPMVEEDFANYPKALAYVEEHRETLAGLSREEGSQWFSYGRSQSLNTVPLDKIVVASAVSPKSGSVSFKKLVGVNAVYSGLLILEKSGGLSLDEVVEVLSSVEFYQYCLEYGKPIGNGWRTVSAPLLKKFPLPEKYVKVEEDLFNLF